MSFSFSPPNEKPASLNYLVVFFVSSVKIIKEMIPAAGGKDGSVQKEGETVAGTNTWSRATD